MPVVLGSDSAWRVRRIGQFTLSYQWLDGDPAMFLYPSHGRRGGALAIPLASAWQWAQSDGYPDLSHAIPTAHRACDVMGLTPDKSTIHSIVTTVLDGIPDLIQMPPSPPPRIKPAPNIGEMTITEGHGGRVVHQADVPAFEDAA